MGPDEPGARAAEKKSKAPEVDVTQPKEMMSRYMRRSESGRELRQLHRKAARQYQSMYGYTLFSFFAIAGIAYGLGTWSQDRSAPEASSNEEAKK